MPRRTGLPKTLDPRLVEQVRDNVVELLCPFVELAGSAPAALSEMCPVASRSNPVPIFAVMGNHDLNDPGSAALQQGELPKLVPNWIMAEDGARVFEVADGLSVVLVESEPFTAKGAEAKAIRAKLIAALQASKGPWRILVVHRPVAVGALGTGHTENWYTRRFAKALAMAEVPVQLMLSGDQHNLQLIDGRPPAPRLNAIAGSGSSLREVGPVHERHLFAAESPGFVRVDWIRDDAYPRLVVTAYTTHQREGPGFGVPVVAARWSVDRAGALRDEQTGVPRAPLDAPPATERQDAAPGPGRPTEHQAAPGG